MIASDGHKLLSMVSQYKLSTDRLLLGTTPLTYPNTADKHKHMQTSSLLHSHCKIVVHLPTQSRPSCDTSRLGPGFDFSKLNSK